MSRSHGLFRSPCTPWSVLGLALLSALGSGPVASGQTVQTPSVDAPAPATHPSYPAIQSVAELEDLVGPGWAALADETRQVTANVSRDRTALTPTGEKVGEPVNDGRFQVRRTGGSTRVDILIFDPTGKLVPKRAVVVSPQQVFLANYSVEESAWHIDEVSPSVAMSPPAVHLTLFLGLEPINQSYVSGWNKTLLELLASGAIENFSGASLPASSAGDNTPGLYRLRYRETPPRLDASTPVPLDVELDLDPAHHWRIVRKHSIKANLDYVATVHYASTNDTNARDSDVLSLSEITRSPQAGASQRYETTITNRTRDAVAPEHFALATFIPGTASAASSTTALIAAPTTMPSATLTGLAPTSWAIIIASAVVLLLIVYASTRSQ